MSTAQTVCYFKESVCERALNITFLMNVVKESTHTVSSSGRTHLPPLWHFHSVRMLILFPCHDVILQVCLYRAPPPPPKKNYMDTLATFFALLCFALSCLCCIDFCFLLFSFLLCFVLTITPFLAWWIIMNSYSYKCPNAFWCTCVCISGDNAV